MKQPKLRFPEFTGDWKQHKFEDVVAIGSGKDYKHLESGNVPVYGTGGYMLSVNQALSESEDAVGIGRKGTIDKPYILRAPFWTVDTLFYCIPNKGFDLTFTNCLFQNVDWKKKDESTGVPSLSKVIINNVKTYVPSLEEQQKIASLFSELDTLIQSAEKELDGYRELKQSMLQKMFPKKGDKVPEIRFPEFTGDWEQRKLGDTIPVVTDYVAAGSFADIAANVDYKSEPDYAQLVRTVDLKHDFENNDSIYVDKKAFDYLYRVNLDEESIVLPNIGANIGEVYYIEPSALPYERNVLGPNAIYLKPCKNTKFIYSLFQTVDFQKKLMISIASSGQPKFNKTELKEITITLPNNDEQKKIGEYFSNLDNLITIQQQELDGYKELKKGLLQQMFC